MKAVQSISVSLSRQSALLTLNKDVKKGRRDLNAPRDMDYQIGRFKDGVQYLSRDDITKLHRGAPPSRGGGGSGGRGGGSGHGHPRGSADRPPSRGGRGGRGGRGRR